MKQMKTLTVNGVTYTVTDPNAPRLDDTAVGEGAWSAKKIVDTLCPAFSKTGDIVTCNPVAGYPLQVEAQTPITRCGKNLAKLRSLTTDIIGGLTSKVEADGTLSVNGESTIDYNNVYITNVSAWGEPLRLGAGKYTLLCRLLEGTVTDAYGVLQISKLAGGTGYEYFELGAPLSFQLAEDCRVMVILQFRKGGTAVDGKLQLQLEVGETATAYEPFRQDIFEPGQTVPALPGVNTIRAESGQVTVTGRADPAYIIEKLGGMQDVL